MPYSPRVLSLNVGKLRSLQVGGKVKQTGLFKQPMQGPQRIDENGLPGDNIVNRRFHGGPDQAVYLYSQDDIDWWKQQLQRDLAPGFFGENLTITHWWPKVRVGDILQAGELIMQITAPRTPCAVLAARVGDPAFIKQFVRAARGGAYARVLRPGTISPGDTFHVTAADDACPAVEDLFRYWHSKTQDADFLRRALAAPIAMLMREALEEKLLKAEAGATQLPMF